MVKVRLRPNSSGVFLDAQEDLVTCLRIRSLARRVWGCADVASADGAQRFGEAYSGVAMQEKIKRRFRVIGGAIGGAALVSFFVHTFGHGSSAAVVNFIPGWFADATAFVFLAVFLIGLPIFGLYMILDKDVSDRFGTLTIGWGALFIWAAAIMPVVYALWLE